MSGPRIGSLCSGYEGLGMAVQAVIPDAELAWVSDIDKGACKVLAHHYPDVPNLGDFTKTDWSTVEPIDILTAGYPCQPFSHAGNRKGANDERHLWPAIREAIRGLRPRLTLLENVAGHRSLGFDRVLGDLAEDGLHVQWTSVRASDVGACHRRERLFIAVTPNPASDPWRLLDGDGAATAVTPNLGHERSGRAWRGWDGPADGGLLPTPTARDSKGRNQRDDATCLTGALLPTPMAQEPGGTPEQYRARWMKSDGRNSTFLPLSMAVQLLPTPTTADHKASGSVGYGGNKFCTLTDATVRKPQDWGDYANAIEGWEVLTRPAPAPTQLSKTGTPQLSAAFSEWMMGLPAGWITDVPGITRNEALKLAGNGVVPQQAEAALRIMLARAEGIAA